MSNSVIDFSQALERLEERTRNVITMRMGLDGQEGRTQEEVAQLLGLSRSEVSRLERRAVMQLRKNLIE